MESFVVWLTFLGSGAGVIAALTAVGAMLWRVGRSISKAFTTQAEAHRDFSETMVKRMDLYEKIQDRQTAILDKLVDNQSAFKIDIHAEVAELRGLLTGYMQSRESDDD